jgi:hypothetical protein
MTEAFGALRGAGVGGLPRNLATLHHPLVNRPVAGSLHELLGNGNAS